MQADRHDVLVIPKPRPITIVLGIVAMVVLGIGYLFYHHTVVVHQAAVDAVQQRLTNLKGKSASIGQLTKEIGTQWIVFYKTAADGTTAGTRRHDGYIAGTLSDADAKVLAQTELTDAQALDPILTTIQSDDIKLVSIYSDLYGADAANAFARDSEKRTEDFAQMQTYWWRAAQDNVDNITAVIKDAEQSNSSSDIQSAYNQSDSYANMAKALNIDVQRDAKVLDDRLSADIKNAQAALSKLQ